MCTSHFFVISSEFTFTPLEINAPDCFSISLSGLSIPSKILFKIPGAKVTKIALSVPYISSPGFRPLVSS